MHPDFEIQTFETVLNLLSTTFDMMDSQQIEIKKFSDTDCLLGLTGGINIVYNYDETNNDHVAEVNRLKNDSSISTEYIGSGKLRVQCSDFETYPAHQWNSFTSNPSWVSTVLTFDRITNIKEKTILYRIANYPVNNVFFTKIENGSLEMNTDTKKMVITSGDYCSVAALPERLPINTYIGPLRVETSGTCYVAVINMID